MKILAIERETAGTARERLEPLLVPEAARAWELHQAGVIRELYFRQDARSAVLILECPGVEEAHDALKSLPLVDAGLISFDLIPLVPYPGFARLFAEPHRPATPEGR